jgi:hypothetical protein
MKDVRIAVVYGDMLTCPLCRIERRSMSKNKPSKEQQKAFDTAIDDKWCDYKEAKEYAEQVTGKKMTTTQSFFATLARWKRGEKY